MGCFMKKEFATLLLVFICLTMFTGCQQTQNIKLTYKPFSDDEQYLLTLTNNKILMYDLKNLPTDNKYTIILTYEVYKDSKKIKDEIITQAYYDGSAKKYTGTKVIGINITSNTIRCVLTTDSAYINNKLDINQDFSNCSQTFLSNDVALQPGKDIYLFYATTSTNLQGSLTNGTHVDDNMINDIVKDNELHAFIKLKFEEN